MHSEFLAKSEELIRDKKPFAVATVIRVHGSASARPGSKVLISGDGKNVWGWVGGGCAESFVIRNAQETLITRESRIVEADLDDEVFGLGMPCGGKMEVYIEPVFPPEILILPEVKDCADFWRGLARFFHVELEYSSATFPPPLPASLSPSEKAVARFTSHWIQSRKLSGKSLRETKGVYKNQRAPQARPMSELVIVGASRISEELAKLSHLLGWKTRVVSANADAADYPETTVLEAFAFDPLGLRIHPSSFVLVASHHKGDPEFISAALKQGAGYVGLVASGKRSGIVFDSIQGHDLSQVFAPAGLEMNCQTPAEIGLSILTEMILVKHGIPPVGN